MGIETEYGITVPGHPNANAMVLSTHVVNAYASDRESMGRHAHAGTTSRRRRCAMRAGTT